MITFKRADHIHITVPPDRLEDALNFYSEVLGLQLIERPDHLFHSAGYWFSIADIQLHIGVEAIMPLSSRHSAFEIDDVAVARKYLNGKVEILEEPAIPGRVRFAFRDPFGNRIELLEYVR